MKGLDACGAHWLYAGAGAGKTMGIRHWLGRMARPYAWIQLEPSDQDPLLLLQHLYEAFLPLLCSVEQIPELYPNGSLSLDRHCEFVWDRIVASLAQPAILVLDDAHLIADWRAHPVLHHVLTKRHEGLRVVVLSRQSAPDAYARQVVNRELCIIGPQTLVWTKAQVQDWLSRRWKIEDSGEDFLESLLQISQGHAGILALLDLAELHRAGASMQRAAEQIELGALMERSLLSRLSSIDLEALRWLACLGSFPGAWLEELGFSDSVRSCVQEWSRQGAVLTRLDRSPEAYRFHPLLAELLKRGEAQLHPELATLRRALVDRCVAQKRLQDALELALGAKDWSLYWELIEEHSLAWIQNGQFDLLDRWLGALPSAVRAELSGPKLSLFEAALLLHKNPALAYRYGMDAVKASAKPGLWGIWAMALEIAASSVIAGGQSLALLGAVADEVRQAMLCPWFEELHPSHRLRALKAGVISCMPADGRMPLDAVFPKACAALEDSDDVELQADVVSSMMRIVALHGLAEFHEPVALHLNRLDKESDSPTATTAVSNAKTSQFLALGRRADCVKAAVATLSGYSDQTPSVWRIEVLCMGTYGYLARHNLAGARGLCQKLQELTAQVEYESVSHHWQLHAGAIAAHDGDLQRAKHHFEQCVRYSDAYGYPFMQIIARSCLLVVALELGQRPLADLLLEQGDEILARCYMPLVENVHAGSRAYHGMVTLPQHEACLASRRLFDIMEKTNNYGLALDLLPQYSRFLAFALEHEIRPDLVRDIICRTMAFPKARPHPDWPSLYQVSVLGGFDLRINGQSERGRFVSSGRRFELLTFLLWKGGREVSHEACYRYIWPYIEGKKRLRRTLKLALSRLRDDLGRQDAILDADDKISLNPELWSYDAWELEALLQDAPARLRAAHLIQIERGFVGPTPFPESLRGEVPNAGGVDLGPERLMQWLLQAREARSDSASPDVPAP